VDETAIGEHQKELARLEVQAARLSVERDRLHRQIDFGFETAATRERERQVSDERRQLHKRIDALKKQLRTQQIA
jgi:50S ribosomal subunit-associated GTPase HflX